MIATSTELQAIASSARVGPYGETLRTRDIREPNAGDETDYTAIDLARRGSEREQDKGRVYHSTHGRERGKMVLDDDSHASRPSLPDSDERHKGKAGGYRTLRYQV